MQGWGLYAAECRQSVVRAHGDYMNVSGMCMFAMILSCRLIGSFSFKVFTLPTSVSFPKAALCALFSILPVIGF